MHLGQEITKKCEELTRKPTLPHTVLPTPALQCTMGALPSSPFQSRTALIKLSSAVSECGTPKSGQEL